MQNKVYILNGHVRWDASPGELNRSAVSFMRDVLNNRGYIVRTGAVDGPYDIDREIELHRWADFLIYQFPVNLMGLPWKAKKYMEEISMAGLDGRLANGDGRSAGAPDKNYGMGGALTGTRSMMSVTFNAPKAAFENPDEPFFRGKSIDDLLYPQHCNFRFLGVEPLPTFAFFDVMKNPTIDADFERLRGHLHHHFAPAAAGVAV